MAVAAALAVAGCGGGARPTLSAAEAARLPVELGSLNGLCTDLPQEWRDPAFRRERVRILARTRALTEVVDRAPAERVRVRFREAHSGDTETVVWDVRRLAREQLALHDSAGYCSSPVTPAPARRAGRAAVAALRAAVAR